MGNKFFKDNNQIYKNIHLIISKNKVIKFIVKTLDKINGREGSNINTRRI